MDTAVPPLPRQEAPEPTLAQALVGSSFSVGSVAESLPPVLSRGRSAVSTAGLQTAWVHFLSGYEWQWFVTCTFREAVHPERADKAFRYWVGLIDKSRLGSNFRRPFYSHMRTRWVRALEWQRRDVIHYHALVGNLDALGAMSEVREHWAQTWNTIGGFGKVDLVGRVSGVCGYVAKYVAKGGQIDLCDWLVASHLATAKK